MAQLTLTIPNDQVPRVLAAFGDAPFKAPTDTPTPATAEEVRQVLIKYVKEVVRAYEHRQAQQAIVVTPVDAT